MKNSSTFVEMKKVLSIFFLVQFILGSAQYANADELFLAPIFTNYTLRTGLSNNYCIKTLQDQHGYMWFATFNGLSRFNGKEWVYFKVQSKEINRRIPSNWVIDISLDQHDNLWINTDNGLCFYNQKKDEIENPAKKITGWGKLCFQKPNAIINGSFYGIDKNIIENNALKFYTRHTSLEKNSIQDLFTDSENTVWACLEDDRAISSLQPNGKISKINIKNDAGKNIQVLSISQFSKDTLLLSTKTEGVLKYNKSTKIYTSISNEKDLQKSGITCSYVYFLNGTSYVWIGTQNNGIFIFNTKTNKILHFKHQSINGNSIISNSITNIFEDRQKGIWISTAEGVSYFHPSLQKNGYYYLEDAEKDKQKSIVNAVAKVDENNYLVATEGSGVLIYNKNTRVLSSINTPETSTESFPNIAEVKKGIFYLSSQKGIYQYEKNYKRLALKKINADHSSFTQVKKLNDSLVGYTTHGGFLIENINNNKVLLNVKTSEEYGGNIYRDMILVKDNLFVMKAFSGIVRYSLKSKKLLEDITPKEFVAKAIDYHQLSSDENTIYCATTKGIISYDILTGKNEIINTESGLEGNYITNVVVYKHQIYYNTVEGLFKYENKKSTPVAFYENYIQKWYNQLQVSDQTIISSIGNGFLLHHLNNILKKNEIIPVKIEKVFINDIPYKGDFNRISLKYFENNISIKLASFYFIEPEKSKWQYSLHENSSKWENTESGEINLYNLPAGTYHLFVRSINNTGDISKVMKITNLEISAVFYKQLWFITLLFGILFSIIYLGYRNKINQLRKIKLLRAQISRDLHDELGANVSCINIMANILTKIESDNKQIIEITTNISIYSKQISDTINDIIWNINPKFDTVEDIINKIKRHTSNQSEMLVTIHQSKELNWLKINQILKYNLYLIIKEIFNNAMKYSKAENFILDFNYTDKILLIKVSDDGIGITDLNANLGNGLANIKYRAKEINATIAITSDASGTKFLLTLKV